MLKIFALSIFLLASTEASALSAALKWKAGFIRGCQYRQFEDHPQMSARDALVVCKDEFKKRLSQNELDQEENPVETKAQPIRTADAGVR